MNEKIRDIAERAGFGWRAIYEDDGEFFELVKLIEAQRPPNPIPNATTHNPSPANLRALLVAAGLSQRAYAARIGVNERTVRGWLHQGGKVPYWAQFMAECLVSGHKHSGTPHP